MDKKELLKMYKESKDSLREKREQLNEMAEHRLLFGEPLTDSELIKQSNTCSELSLQIMKIKEMIEDSE